jgi:hypothetical protein
MGLPMVGTRLGEVHGLIEVGVLGPSLDAWGWSIVELPRRGSATKAWHDDIDGQQLQDR